jgi:hypothetical protein
MVAAVRRFLFSGALAVLVGLLGPRLFGPHDHPAGVPFAYTPPEGFVERSASSWSHGTDAPPGAKVWIYADSPSSAPSTVAGLRQIALDGPNAVHAVLHHSAKEMSVEEADLARLAEEMPRAFEDSCTWVHRRHELRTLKTGARVGLIEGDCTRDLDLGSLGGPSQKIRARKLQLLFPDDDGTSIVTASYPIEQAPRWEPVFEATIAKARGVATRVPPPSVATSIAWGGAAAVLAWLAAALAATVGRKKQGQSP